MTGARTTTRRPAPSCGRPGPARPRGTARTRPSTGRRPRRRRWAGWGPVGLVALAVLVGLAWRTGPSPDTAAITAPGRCTVVGGSLTLTHEQAADATTIAAVARARQLPDRAVVIALATAQQESGLRNLHYGDRDSLGLFQQRPSQGWGTPEQILDPGYAAGRFFDHLVRVPGWQTGRLTDVAQTVQRSAAPEAYQRWETMATQLTEALRTGGLHCS